MVTGSVPFEGANPFLIMNARLTGDPAAPRQKNPQVSPQVEEIILKAMSRNPQDRYQTALDMKADLDRPDEVHVTGRASRLEAPAPWKSRWRGVRVTVLAVLIPLLVLLAVFLARHLSWK
jgi:serine/threonine protein kinase